MPGSIFLQVANQPPASQQQGKIMAAEVDFSGPLCRKGSLVPCSLFSILYWLALDYCWNTAASHAFVSFYKIPTLLGILHLALKRAKLMKLKLYFANTRLVSGCTAWLFRYQKKECHSYCLVHFSFGLHVKLSLFYILKFLNFVKRNYLAHLSKLGERTSFSPDELPACPTFCLTGSYGCALQVRVAGLGSSSTLMWMEARLAGETKYWFRLKISRDQK